MKKKFKFSFIFEKLRRLPLKLISIILVIIISVSLLAVFSLRFIYNSSFFQIKEIIVSEDKEINLSYLKGMNIFTADLSKVSIYIQDSYPTYSKIRLIRILPDRIFVDFVKRRPMALVKLYRNFVLGKDGVIFYASGEPEEQELPVILGLDTKIFGPKPGKKYNVKEVRLVLSMIQEIARNNVLGKYKIKKINVSDPDNSSVVLSLPQQAANLGTRPADYFGDLEVKLGQEDIRNKILILASLIKQTKMDLNNIIYVDLRFKEPVIKLRDAK